jgi:hypothetical protein
VAGSEGRRPFGAFAFASLVVAAAACAPPIPLERLPCPCSEGYLCCERELVCYRAEDMPATCAPVGLADPADSGADVVEGGAETAAAADAADTAASPDGSPAPDSADAGDAVHAADAAGGTDTAGGADAIGGDGGGSGGTGGGGTGGSGTGGGGGIGGGGTGGGGSGGGGTGGSGTGGNGTGGGGGIGGGGTGGGDSGGGSSGGGGTGGGGTAGAGTGGGGTGGRPPVVDRSTVDGYFLPPPAILTTAPWHYTTDTPAGDWTQPAFDTTGWWTGKPGFLGGPPAFGDNPQTPWPEGASDLWLRTTFQIDEADIPRALLWGRWDDWMEVYVNGVLAAPVEAYTPAYRYLGLKAGTLLPGALNTLAVHAIDVGGARYLDVAVALNEGLTTMPMSGFEHTPTLAAYATAVRQFMRDHGIPGGVLAVMKKNKVVVNRAFGWADKGCTRPLLPDAVMRVGGLEVILTAGAVATLIDARIEDPITRQRITRDTRVFPLLRAHGLAPLPGRTPVPEIDQVTVGMLLAFESGVSELPGDPAQIYADLGVAPGSPVTAEDNVRWVYSMPLARPLGSPPGDGYVGYMLLRHLVHVVTGDLLSFLRTAVFAPVGSSDVFIAHEPLASRDAREPGYMTLEQPVVRSIHLEHYHALATTAEAFVRYLRRYHAFWGTPLIDAETQQWAAIPDNGTHIVVSAGAGTWNLTQQRRHDEVSIAVFFNMAGDYNGLFEQLDRITDSLPASAWGL